MNESKTVSDLVEEVTTYVAQLQAENAKLRELCEYLWEFAKTCGADHPFLHELGVEVDG